jgi:hypothetical protein
MSFTKDLGNDLTVSLLSEDPFLYAHLVKFEKVSQSADGQIAEKASDYSYISDASFDVKFDDGSKNLSGTSNGEQTYIANRLTKVSNISETTEAKVSNVNLTISSIALNSEFTGSATNRITVTNSGGAGCSIQIVDTTNDNWTTLGFSEGDKITISSSDANHGKSVIISGFTNNNYTATCILASSTTTNVANVTNYTITLETDEVTAILNDPASASYNGYINREVSVYKAHIDPDTGVIIGTPYMLFKGIISKAKLTDDPTKSSSVNWTLTSHWGDFVRVNGRITSDAEHRALGANGQPDMGALYRDDYAMDLGFMHGDQAINMMAIYQVMETRYKMKKSGFIFKKYKMKEYQVEVDKEVDLRINLDAKRLPIIYGVQRTDSIPIFADSLHADPAKIYVAYAICEGEVSGLYDIYMDDQSRICIDKNDSDTRSTQTGEGTIDVVCEGRMDRGDTLSSAPSVRAGAQRGFARGAGSFNIYNGGIYSGIGNYFDNFWFEQNLIANSNPLNVNGATGITHEKQTTVEFPIPGRLVFHSGKSHQRADDTLTRIAQAGRTVALKANGFKLQADTENPEEYWTSNHRLLDTAYVVAEYTIGEGDTTIPNLEFVVRGKEIEQYNYDYSYDVHPNPTLVSGTIADKRALFKVGDTVDFYTLASGNAALATDVQIMDSTIYYDADGTAQYKFRFSGSPLGTSTSTTEFYMVQADVSNTSDARYPMITWDYKSNSGTVATRLTQPVTVTAGDGSATVANTDVANGTGVDISELIAEIQAILAASGSSVSVGFVANGQAISDAVATFLRRQANPATSGGTTTDKDAGGTQVSKSSIEHYALLNAIKLASGASSVDDYYKGQIITVVNTDAEGLQKRQSRKIIKYTGSTKVAVVGALFETAADASTVSGTFTTTEASWQATTIKLNSTTGLVVNQFLLASTDGLAQIESGTQITAINGLTVTVSKTVKLRQGAVISALASGGGDLTKEQPTDFDFVPSVGDTYEIASEGDKKVSINPAIQLLDYLRNGRYGRGLDLDKDIDLETFKQSARLCDTRSDISLILPNSGTYTVGNKWKYVSTVSGTGYFQWQGTIKSVVTAGTGHKQVTFTDCIGKIAHKWFDWKSYEIGNAVYHKVGDVNKVYMVTTAGTLSEPNAGNAASLAITKVGTSTTASVHGVASAGATESNSGERDNPIVKSWNGGASSTLGNYEKSGYQLYDSDDVKYWRYMGWQDHNQREVTRHQTNALIRTDTPLFDNVNSMLKHFNGILRYSNGKYELDVESTTPTIAATSNITTSGSYTGSAGASNTSAYIDPRIINEGDIIGAITVDDSGLKGIANTVSVTIADPNIRYDNRSVSFFKSEYLKEDRNIPKKKDIKTPLITNYFNARINAEQYLDQSRFSRKINFVIGPQGVLLLAGNIIKMNYERFGWVNKDFRISNLSYRPDCSVQVTAEEHNDDTYIINAKEKTYQSAGPISAPGDEIPAPNAPANLTATGKRNAISLKWINTLNFGNQTTSGATSAGWSTEIYYNNHASFTNQTADTEFSNGAVKIHTTQGQETWEHPFPDLLVDTTRYYWIRHVKTVTKPNGVRIQKLSSFTPVSTGNGVSGTATATGAGSGIVYLYKSSVDEPTDDPSDDTLFPTVTVALSGDDAGKITGVATGQSSAALTSNQIIDTNGAATGWFTVPAAPTNEQHVIWLIAATASSTGSTDEILRAEWTEPVKFSGTSGLNSAIVDLYQLTNSSSAPADPSGTLVYTFSSGALATNNINSWSQTPASPSSNNQYLWKITAAAIAYGTTHTIPTADWSAAIKLAQYIVGAEGDSSKAVKLTANQYAIPFTEAGTESTTLTFTATPQNLEGTGTYYFEVDSGSGFAEKQAASTTATYAMAQGDEPASGDAHVVKVTMYDAGTAVATDSVSIYGVQDGTDALTIIVSNEAHVLPSANNGTVSSYSGSGTDIRIYKGATLLTAATSGTTANTFKASASGSSITISSTTGTPTNVLGGAPTNETLRYADHSSMTADLASITYTITVYDGDGIATTYTKVQSFSKSRKGDTGQNGTSTTGPQGDSGPRASNFIIYHSAGSASSPGNPTASLYTFANNTFTSLSSGWSTSAPQAVAGTTTSNYWYATVNANEGLDSNGDGTGNTSGTGSSLTISNAYIGLGFTGLVTFNALSTSGSTTIHGGNITTGSINANRINLGTNVFNLNQFVNGPGYTDDTAADAAQTDADTAQNRADSAYNLAGGKNKTFYDDDAPTSGMIEGDLWVDSNAPDISAKYYRRSSSGWVAINPSTVGGWTLTAGALYSGTLVNGVNDTFTSGAGHISLNSGGSIHTPKFYVNQSGNAGFSGVLTFGTGTLDVGAVNVNTITNSSITLTNLSGANNLENRTPGQQVQEAFTQSTNITAGKIRLQSSSQSSDANNCIELDATSNTIVIKDAGVSRVIIGKLS